MALRAPDAITFNNYYGNKNCHIVTALRQLVVSPASNGEVVYLYGENVGKSHLVQATCNYAQACADSVIYLPLQELAHNLAEILVNLEFMSIVCVDDVQILAGNLESEKSFFYFYNKFLANNGKLVLTANKIPQLLNFLLPDLVSRFMASTIYGLDFLDDDDKMNLIVGRAADLGIVLSEAVARFILTRGDRRVHSLMRYLSIIERESLRTKRSVTIPFVKDLLQFNKQEVKS